MKKNTTSGIALTFIMLISAFTFSLSGYKPGDSAEDFKLKNVDGKEVTLAGYKDAKGFIIVFTCNHCPFAKAYEQRILDLDKKYAAQGYPVIAINPNDPIAYPDDSFENMVKRAKEKKYTFPYLMDETQEVAKKYGALKTPHVYILKKDKDTLKVEYIGAIDDNSEDANQVKNKYAETALNELLAGKPVTVKETKAIGCGVKWKK
jgi:peroxiredoxin